MFAIDERFPDLMGGVTAVRDDVRGLALRLKERGPGGEGDQYRFVRHGREYVLFVSGGISRDRKSVVFTIEHGNLSDDRPGLLASLSRRFIVSDLGECFRAFARLVYRFDGDDIEINFREPETLPTYQEMVMALAGMRTRNPKLLDELYETLEADLPLSGDQFGALLRCIKALRLRKINAHAFASDMLPHVVMALKGPFARRAPNFVRQAMDRIAVTSVLVIAMIAWAVPNGIRVILDIVGGQLQKEALLDQVLDLMAGALALSIGGAAIYSTIVILRLGRREQILNYIRTGKTVTRRRRSPFKAR
jgi:hypothetical protein